MFESLPSEIERLAHLCWLCFQVNPSHPSPRHKKVQSRLSHFEVTLNRRYRAVYPVEDGDLIWIFIGTHADFDRDFS